MVSWGPMEPEIVIKKAAVHNLKKVDLTLPYQKLIVFTGVSGSGKSSMAFDTIYVEGQRRYIESLSHSVRRNFSDLVKPDAEIEGIAPTIAIEQKTKNNSPRSTVGTLTGIYDFLRVLFAKIATPFCPISKEPLKAQSREKILLSLEALLEKAPEKTKFILLAPFAQKKKGEFKEEFSQLLQKGFTRARINGSFIELTEEISLDKKKAHDIDLVIDRISNSKESFSRTKEAAANALEIGKGLFSLFFVDSKEEILFSEFGYSKKAKTSYPPLEAQDFSFNHPKGMCDLCKGLGIYSEFDLTKIIDPEKSIQEDCCLVATSYQTVRYKNIYDNLAKLFDFSVKTPWKKLPEEAKHVFLYGTKKKWTLMQFSHPHKKRMWTEYVRWKGVLEEAHKKVKEAKSELYRKKKEELMHITLCPHCEGSRLKPYPSSAKLQGKTLQQITQMTLEELSFFIRDISLHAEEALIAQELLKEITERLRFLTEVGLGYLSLERTSSTLSGGESQRVRLASQIGSGLVGAIYVLDEPSIGLHPQDHHLLIASLKRLKDLGNTVIVVEHDEEMMKASDLLVDFGPKAGKNGGEIVAIGSYSDIVNNPKSLTGAYLSQKKEIPFSSFKRTVKKGLFLQGASHHNLKNINAKIPLGGLICVTGVSGSGKSSLLIDTIYPALCNKLHHSKLEVGAHKKLEGLELVDKIIAIDQSPIGRTPRSNAGTYLKILDEIRDLFASLKESQVRGFKPGHFSFNVKEGSCPYCKGMGYVAVDMDFLEEAFILCPQCKGRRFEPPILEVKYKEHSIYDILEMDLDQALSLFEEIPSLYKKLQVLQKIGLGYLPLGQPSTTLSGGEAQRIKLCKELIRPDTGNTLYVLDEPSTGLHFDDLSHLLQVLEELIQKGNTILVIEHNLDLIKRADYLIEMGPKAGKEGGYVIAEGPPSSFLQKTTPTAKALQNAFIERPSSKQTFSKGSEIVIEKASQNNLKQVDLKLQRGQIIAFTGPSGSGKTSLAFDTIYAEGQRRYTDSLSSYAKTFIKQCPKPIFEKIEGLSPTIALEANKGGINPRSTIGTLTETYDFLRLLYAHLGEAFCPDTGEKIESIDVETVLETILHFPENSPVYILAPLSLQKESFASCIRRLQEEGFLRIRLNGTYYELEDKVEDEVGTKKELFVVVDRFKVKKEAKKRIFEAIKTASKIGNNTLLVEEKGKDHFFNLSFTVRKTGKSFPSITPKTFSFNAEEGMCLECQGIGMTYGFPIEETPLLEYSLSDIFFLFAKELENKAFVKLSQEYFAAKDIDIEIPLSLLDKDVLKMVLKGDKTPYLSKEKISFTFIGIEPFLEKLAKNALPSIRETLLYQMKEKICPFCEGSRLNPLARNVKIKGVSLPQFCSFSIEKALIFIRDLSLETVPFLRESMSLLQKHLLFLESLGIGYLSLDRTAPSLSGGELQRVRLSKQIGASLSGCIYVLDEPTIGLHPSDIQKLNKALLALKALQNTIILVEHDPMTIKLADYIVDFGPKAGSLGGKIMAEGSLEELQRNPSSLTGLYLSGQKKIAMPLKKRKPSSFFFIEKASCHNLKNLSVKIPLHNFTCITGVSGSGKSSLVENVIQEGVKKALYTRSSSVDLGFAALQGLEAFDKLLVLDQSPIGTTPRSDVSTYTDILTPLRRFYASLKLAQAKGLEPKHFSYHHKRGMCKSCYGMGYNWVDLQFLPPVKIACEMCKGYRLNPLSLEVTYKMKNLGEVLEMTIDEASVFFEDFSPLKRKFDLVKKVGLGYVKLGQEILSLSSGEAQRLRLSKELAKRSTGKTLYIFDEPTLGLHPEDIVKLLPLFHALVEKQNTVVVVEHNLDFIQHADYIIELGPEAGDKGGDLLFQGTYEEFLKTSCPTASFLK